MRKFYLTFPQKSQTLSAKSEECQTLSDKFESMLSWSHYCELLKVKEYERQIDQMVYILYDLTEEEIKIVKESVM